MSWKNAVTYLRGIAGKRGLDGQARREDDALPLGARVGSLVRMQRSPVIRAQSNGSLIGMPADGHERILAVSQIKLQLKGGLYRFFSVQRGRRCKRNLPANVLRRAGRHGRDVVLHPTGARHSGNSARPG